jgi:hypothetical protein
MAKHDTTERSAVSRIARIEAGRRAVVVGRVGGLIAVLVAAVLTIGGHGLG